jgi:hypothetical protein
MIGEVCDLFGVRWWEMGTKIIAKWFALTVDEDIRLMMLYGHVVQNERDYRSWFKPSPSFAVVSPGCSCDVLRRPPKW